MSAVSATRRLPGFKFEAQAPPLDEILPRMDIAVFVGFAASGPLETPVAIESEAQFSAIFGDDAPLAWDVERGEQLYAYLAPSVRTFFRNNGRRCWIIRVARREIGSESDLNHARSNYFPIPALARAEFAPGGGAATRITPAFARARSEGSWSDALQLGSALLSRSIQVSGPITTAPDKGYVVRINRPSGQEIGNGDLLRLTFASEKYVLFLPIENAAPLVASPSSAKSLEVTGRRAVWLQAVAKADLPSPGTTVPVALFTRERSEAKLADASHVIAGFERSYEAVLNPGAASSPPVLSPPGQSDTDQTIALLVDCPASEAPKPGSVVRIDLPGAQLWMTVDSLSFSADRHASALITGQALRQVATPLALPTSIAACECLTFELWVRKAEEYSISLSDLGLVRGHERFWGDLPTDEEVYADLDPTAAENPATLLWRQVGDLFRFPLAGVEDENEVYFPLTMLGVPENFLDAVVLEGNERERDGLAEFSADLFLDRDLASTLTETLLSSADFIRYLSPDPRKLNGMHAALALEEATIIAVPDAIQRGWSRRNIGSPPVPSFVAAQPHPDWWHFLDCREPAIDQTPRLSDCQASPPEPSQIPLVHEPRWGNFLNCSIRIIEPPHLLATETISSTGTFTLLWPSALPSATQFVLEQATSADFSDAETIYSGPTTTLTIYGRSDGDYFYRVKAQVRDAVSDWSNGVAVRVATTGTYTVATEASYVPDTLLAVQRGLLRMCAARGDLFCVLSMPEHFREDQTIEHMATLKANPENAFFTSAGPPLDFGEAIALSYGAMFHPWLIDRDENGVYRRSPPCGAAAGVMAQRSITRGAWIAPANEPIRNVVDLEPAIRQERRLDLQNAQINLVRQEPRGFIVLDAETLSDTDDLRPINVRRLLMLLRRQALRLGATYVFEPHSPAFRRLVERGFTDMLDQMFIRGAFAGATPDSSYQVVADDSLNTQQSVDEGRFIVELRVAPSLPLNFLTIRLVQTGGQSVVTEGH